MENAWRDIWRFGGAGLALVSAMALMSNFIDAFNRGRDAIDAAATASRGPLSSMIVGLLAFTASFFWR